MSDAPSIEDGLGHLVELVHRLRAAGVPAGVDRSVTFAHALASFPRLDRDAIYWAGRITLVGRRASLPAYDNAFEAWSRSMGMSAGQTREHSPLSSEIPLGDLTPSIVPDGSDVTVGEHPSPPDDTEIQARASSAAEALRSKSFAELTNEERARVDAMIRSISVRAPTERSRRTRPARQGHTFDVRRTLRGSLRTSGEPIERAWRTRRARRRPLVLVLDVSGSMAPYSRALLQFAYAAMAIGREVEVFCFGTRLTHVTPTLRATDPDRALAEVGRLVSDWDGGTRIGESLQMLLDAWGQRRALRGAVVIVCSDGLERGDPEVLRRQMERLRRLARRIVWTNPLKASSGYAPLARGMVAALPSIDVFLSGHNVRSLEEMAVAIGSQRP